MFDVIQVVATGQVSDLWEQITDAPRAGSAPPRVARPPVADDVEPIADPRHSTMIQEIIDATEARRAANPREDQWPRWPM